MFGVIKLYGFGGRLEDAAPYFGRGPLRFSTSRPYILHTATFTGPDGIVWPLDLRWPDHPMAVWTGVRLAAGHEVTLDQLETPNMNR